MDNVNSILGVVILAMMVLIGYKVGQLVIDVNSPMNVELNHTQFTLAQETSSNITLRWNHFPLKVYIYANTVKNQGYVDDFKNALSTWDSSTNIVSFLTTDDPTNADITVEWVSSLKEKSTDTLGNADIKFVNVSKFGLIQNARIELLMKSDSKPLTNIDMTNLALHEIGHAIGLNHSNIEADIMYPILTIPSTEIKKISSSDLEKLQEAYITPEKPDLVIVNANLTKSTIRKFTVDYYANISMSIENNGLTDSSPSTFLIKANGKDIKQLDISGIPAGDRLNIELGNLKVNDNFSYVEIILDPNNSVDELNETNNIVTLQPK